MVNIKPDEISAILTQQLSGQKTQAELEQIGRVGGVRNGGAGHRSEPRRRQRRGRIDGPLGWYP